MTASAPAKTCSWQREPLLHFILLGGLLFAVQRWRADAPDPNTVVVDAAQRARLAERFATQRGRAPSDEELRKVTERWVDEELLVREALRLGLDRDDPEVRTRLLNKINFIAAQEAVVGEPTDTMLRTFVDAHPERYAGLTRRAFTLVTFSGSDAQHEAERARERLQAGQDHKTVGGRVSTGKRFTPSTIVRTYGRLIADAIIAAPVGEWIVIEIDRGWSVVHVNALEHSETPPLAEIRSRVAQDWADEQRAVAVRAKVERLREQSRVVSTP